MDTIKSRTPNNYHSTKECINDHEYIKLWNDNPSSIDYKIKSYIVRDYCYLSNLSVKQVFENHCKKVGMFYDKNTIEKIQKQDFMKFFYKKVMEVNFHDIKDLIINELFDDFLKENPNRYTGDPERYNIIMNMVDANASLYEIYKKFTNQELDCLGW